MPTNQRARLVLHPVVLVALLLASGLAIGLGFVLRRGGESIAEANGPTHPIRLAGLQVSSDHLDFGEFDPGITVSRALRLRNDGASPITLRIEGSDPFVVTPPTLTVPAGEVSLVTVTASPKRPGSIREELRIFQEGASHRPLVVLLQGNARGGNGVASSAPGAAPAEGTPGSRPEGSDVASARLASGDEGRVGGASPSGAGAQAPGTVSISRSTAEPTEGSDGAPSASGPQVTAVPPGVAVVPFGGSGPTPRSMAEAAPNVPGDAADGETPVPVPRNPRNPRTLEPKEPEDPDKPPPTAPALVVSPASTVSLMGTTNRFYPQQVGVFGSESGGSFSLASSLQWPKIPLAFGQSMLIMQTGASVGTYDRSSGQVSIAVSLSATDSNGNAAPIPMTLTTGTVVNRNSSGVLISVTGQPRAGNSGELRLVGIAKIPRGFKNQAEEQLVIVDLSASLGFGSSGEANASVANE